MASTWTVKIGSMVCVEWDDATSESNQLNKNEVVALPIPAVRTYGILMAKTAEKVTVSGEVLDEKGKEPTYRSTTAIPTGMVKSITKLVEWKENG
jgi:hypothetical protein